MQNSSFPGVVLFGTTKGLNATGDGVLSPASRTPQIFEFRVSNLLPNEGVELGFRKVIADPNGTYWDILGVIVGAKDSSFRPGFLGAGVAVNHNDFASYDRGYQAAAALCSHLLNDGWDNTVQSVIKETPTHLLREQKNKKLQEIDETGHVIALKTQKTWNEDLPKLFALSASQVTSLTQHNLSFVAIHSNADADADEVDADFLEFCRESKNQEISSLKKSIKDQLQTIKQRESGLEEKNEILQQRICTIEEERDLLQQQLNQVRRQYVDHFSRQEDRASSLGLAHSPHKETRQNSSRRQQHGTASPHRTINSQKNPNNRTKRKRVSWLNNLRREIAKVPLRKVLFWSLALMVIVALMVLIRFLFIVFY